MRLALHACQRRFGIGDFLICCMFVLADVHEGSVRRVHHPGNHLPITPPCLDLVNMPITNSDCQVTNLPRATTPPELTELFSNIDLRVLAPLVYIPPPAASQQQQQQSTYASSTPAPFRFFTSSG